MLILFCAGEIFTTLYLFLSLQGAITTEEPSLLLTNPGTLKIPLKGGKIKYEVGRGEGDKMKKGQGSGFLFFFLLALFLSVSAPSYGIPPKEHHFGRGYSALLIREKIPEVWQPVGIDNKMTTTGTHKILVLRVDFSDVQFRSDHDRAYYENIFNGSNGVSAFYTDQSEGKLALNFEISSKVYRLGSINSYGGCSPIIRDAVNAADPDIDFRNYDALFTLYAGPGDLWAFFCPTNSFQPVRTADGATVYESVVCPESDPRAGDLDAPIYGTASHELGHQMGLPDLYAYGWSGVGDWDLMGSGVDFRTWRPFSFGAWSKVMTSWILPILKTGVNEDLSLSPVESSPDVIYKAPVGGSPSSREYFLLEYRAKTGLDQNLPGQGLLIWHIKDDSPYDSNTAVPQSLARTMAPVLVEQADGDEDLEEGNNDGDSGDPFPGSTNNRNFTNSSNPNSQSRNGSDSGVSVTDIREEGGQVKFHLVVVAGPGSFFITITNPTNQQLVSGTILIQATITGSQTIDKVTFQVDNTPIGEDTSAPFEISWSTSSVSDGPHNIIANAIDRSGNIATDSVTVRVDNNPPSITFISPQNNAIVSGIVRIQVSASDAASGVQQVAFYLDSILREMDTSPPYEMMLDTFSLTEGAHTVEARATDRTGKTSTATLTIRVDNTPPTLSIDTPQAGALLSGVVPIQVSASDSIGLNTVEIQIDGQVVSAFGGTPPFTYNWNTLPVIGKNHLIGARAVDLAGNVSYQEIPVQVKNDFISPQVRFALPPAGIRACGTIHFLVDATDNREVLSVDVMEGNTLVKHLTSSPYAFDYAWPTTQQGAHSLTATASDASENTSQASLSIEVVYPQHTPPSSYPVSGPLNLTFTAPETAVTDGFLIYREKGSQGFFTALNPTTRLGNSFLFQIPSSALPPAGLEYLFSLNSLYFSCETQRYEVASPYPLGDLNLDGKVDELDALEIGFYFGTTASSPNFKPHMDLNRDNIIDVNDLNILATLITF